MSIFWRFINELTRFLYYSFFFFIESIIYIGNEILPKGETLNRNYADDFCKYSAGLSVFLIALKGEQ
jgi:hypothetical protein